jgi:hypothetical protein
VQAATKSDPGGLTKKARASELTGAQIRDHCKSKLAAAKVAHGKAQAKEKGRRIKGIQLFYKNEWARTKKRMADARKLAKKRSPPDLVDASEWLRSARDTVRGTIRVFGEAIKQFPELATMKVGGETAGDVLKAAKEARDEIERRLKTLGPKVAKARKRWKTMVKNALKGDRRKVWTKRGSPSWFKGANLVGARKRLAAAKKAPSYEYRSTDGCKVEYLFRGNRLKRVRKNRPNCR